MRNVTKVAKLLVVAVFLVSGLVGAIGQQSPASAASAKKDKSITSYHYIAQPGDSYTLLARKAIQTYGITHKISLSKARILAAETHLTIAAHSPQLNTMQPVSISKKVVKKWVSAAQNISKAKEKLWAVYLTPSVNFNTDQVGQA